LESAAYIDDGFAASDCLKGKIKGCYLITCQPLLSRISRASVTGAFMFCFLGVCFLVHDLPELFDLR
jgi:hypothetical protein